jgi:type IV fimbrial biogenesis protein FimT
MLGYEKRRGMLNTSLSRNTSGFSLIELMIGIAVFAITIAFGISSYRVWIQNTQVRNAAESIQNGLQRARGEAVKNNARVAFILGAGSQSNWTVNTISPAGAVVVPAIESRVSNEGSGNVTRTVLPLLATTLTYGSLGTLVANADGSASLTQVNLTSSVLSAADARNLRIAISAMGGIKMCDPHLAAGSPASCPVAW